MINRITDGICHALERKWPGVKIHTGAVEQGLETPCFFVLPVQSTIQRIRGELFECSVRYAVQYLKADEAEEETLYETAACLFFLLEVIDAGEIQIRGMGMEAQVQEMALHFSVDYSIQFTCREERPVMEELAIDFRDKK